MDSNDKTNDIVSDKKGFFSKMSQPKKAIFIVLIVIIVILVAAGITFAVILNSGKASLQRVDNPRIDKMALEEAKTVYYKGKDYVYNDNLINILLIGTDCRTTVSERREVPKYFDAGNADSFFLLTFDTKNKTISVTSINRYSMTLIDLWFVYDNSFMESYVAQLGIQYNVGNGLEDSCEFQTNAVSRLMNNIPINGYVSLSMPAIRKLNNIVGGIELTALDNIPGKGNFAEDEADYNIGNSLSDVKGKTITLTDDQAYAYLKYRNVNDFGSADVRVERLKQYAKALLKKMMEMTKKDITFPLKVKDSLSDYLLTDIDNFEMIYLLSNILGYKFDMDNIEYLPGTLQMGEKYEEYIIDEDALKEMIVKKFYTKKNN